MMELKPCPFCGGEAVMKSYLTNGGVFTRDNEHVYITCKSCGARSKEWRMSIRYSALEKAEEEWNRRAES